MLLTLSNIFLAVTLHAASPLTCQQGQARVHEFGKVREFALHYCYNKNYTVLMSPECKNGPSIKCTVLNQHPEPIDLKALYKSQGNPAFHLCRFIGGSPELLEFAAGKTWQPLNRCTFPNGSFVDGGTLIQYHIHKKN